VNNKQYDLEM
jgi:hypothetical protein